jgi:hypothetical protein
MHLEATTLASVTSPFSAGRMELLSDGRFRDGAFVPINAGGDFRDVLAVEILEDREPPMNRAVPQFVS